MIETSTLNSNSFYNEEKELIMSRDFNQTEIDFYEWIKPTLNTLVKNPSEETVAKILAFSKSL
jgi:hypothetical protein